MAFHYMNVYFHILCYYNYFSVFGMVYFADLSPDSNAEYMEIHQRLCTAMGVTPSCMVSSSDIKQV